VRVRLVLPVLAALLIIAAPAQAAVPHVVQPGETLWTIASANNLTTRTVAAFNGLSENSQVVLGSTVMVPTTVEGYSALQRAGLVSSTPSTTTAAAPSTASAAPAAATGTAAATGAPAPQGAYTVRWGDSLSALAAQAGVSAADMAAMNGLSLNGTLLAGTVIKLPTGAPTPVRASQPAPAPVVAPASPVPTSTRLSAAQIQQVAAANGISPSLAAAVAWQESGFNNGMVSSANARGVMQVMPGTWQFVEQNLAGRRLDPASATDNTTAGVLYLKHLLADSGGDEATAIAGYYQGLSSVRARGMYSDTQRYVANVQALRSRFGG
jgi:soluble lytic murein transglycosylase-like protein